MSPGQGPLCLPTSCRLDVGLSTVDVVWRKEGQGRAQQVACTTPWSCFEAGQGVCTRVFCHQRGAHCPLLSATWWSALTLGSSHLSQTASAPCLSPNSIRSRWFLTPVTSLAGDGHHSLNYPLLPPERGFLPYLATQTQDPESLVNSPLLPQASSPAPCPPQRVLAAPGTFADPTERARP